MQQLDTCAALVDAFGGDPALRQRIEEASARLRSGLLDAVQTLHPEHVFKVPQEQSEACAVFLTTFLDTGGHLLTGPWFFEPQQELILRQNLGI